ncbi:glycerophosphoryl diester phosphodiesterase [Candidatus Scalindua japonica]|uniref:Glycerophosphoryl diester phosphodiesterase n=1 Tax=Candidatus Scalindua japonica TaxID=1284222 RepID=A0A286TW38_9BACT|nr:HEAT repeat domain-containing protein [Candidatus Scalindua japonica]GAX60116.1 glycerophosphoryl diester phosphodiesterase [Candidatus Scalindua japonica]
MRTNVNKVVNKLPCIISITLLIFIISVEVAIPEELSRDIVIIARHGSLEDTPENTIAAFEKTADIGIRGLEIDVRRTRDGRLVLMHDATIDRTTDGIGYVSNLPYEEIKLYDAGSWKSEEFTGERVPLLSEAIQFAKERKMKLIVNVQEHGIEQEVLSLIEEYDMINHVYFSGRLQYLRDKDLDIKGAQLVFLPPDEAIIDNVDLIHERHNHVGTRLFGTDDRDKMKKKMFQGIDIILTDYPSVAIDLLHFRTINKPEKREPREKLETNIAGNTEQISALIDTIASGSPDQSRMAALVFSTLPAGLAVPPLVKCLDYKKPVKRFLPKIKFRIPFINNEIQEDKNLLPTAQVQKNIVWSLGLIKNSSAVKPLIKRFETADSGLKREIIQALKMIGDKQAVPVLKEILLNDEDLYVRFDAARALGDIDNTDSVFTLIRAMKTDKSWLVKGSCAGALGKRGDNRASFALKTLLDTDEGDNASWARDRAAWALSKTGIGGTEALVSSLGATGTSTRRRAAWALIDIGDPAVPYLLSALKEVSPFARKRAAMTLGWIGNKKAVLPLTWALADKDREVKKMAAWALGKIGDDKAITALERTVNDYIQIDEDINEQIMSLNEQILVLEDQIAVLENEMTLQETGEANIISNNSEDREYCFNKTREVWNVSHIIAHIARLEIYEAEKNKIHTSIKSLKNVLQENEELTNHAKEAIQRLNYN